jgi:hypothetical protein
VHLEGGYTKKLKFLRGKKIIAKAHEDFKKDQQLAITTTIEICSAEGGSWL